MWNLNNEMAKISKVSMTPVTSTISDNQDVSQLLQEIRSLKIEVNDIRAKLELTECTVTDLRAELAFRNNAVATAPAPCIEVSPTSAQNVNTQRRGGRVTRRRITRTDTPADKQVIDRPLDVPQKSIPKETSSVPKKTFAQVVNVPKQAPVHQAVDDNGFTLVEKKKRRSILRNHRGTATSSTLKAAEPVISMYLSRFCKNTSSKDVQDYIKTNNKLAPVSGVFELEVLESQRKTNFKSFVLRFPASVKDVLFSADFWPAGIVYRRFREARPILENPKL